MAERNLDAYYYSFEPTGCDLVDAVLEQVARAGKAFHGTEYWNDEDTDGQTPVAKMQTAANASARSILALIAENERLEQALSAPETITAEPAGEYEALRKQFMSLRMLANSNAKMVQHWRDQCGRETRETLLANAANVNAERDTNAMLTDALEAAEAERDQIRAEVEALHRQVDTLTEWYANALNVINECSAVLPDTYYMDPPDGGDVSIPEQLRRMARDAERYRHYRMGFVDPEKVDRDIDAAMSKGGQGNG